ncbi:MAG: MGH1-like glycoside hydrolase domain-containing protein [Dysgonomonas sp.]
MNKSILLLIIIMSFYSANAQILKPESYYHYIDSFNINDEDLTQNYITNSNCQDFIFANIPLLDCSDKDIELTYYFRWWTYRKHIKQTPDGFVITEFLPDVPWAGKYNTISCPAAMHFYEGRWLRNRQFLDDYARFWFNGGDIRLYSCWIADALYNQYLVTGDNTLIEELLPDLIDNYKAWEKDHLSDNGLFWQVDDRDGMEVSVCGSGYRTTINSYMYGDSKAISAIAKIAGHQNIANEYSSKAINLKLNVEKKLWDEKMDFFKVLPRDSNAVLCTARELHGYTPWYFNMPEAEYSVAWKFLTDSAHFFAPFGPTTVERCNPDFKISYTGHECQWNGPTWPYATSITLTALANLLNNYSQKEIKKEDYCELLKIYSKSQRRKKEDGRIIPWIDENLNPFSGDWVSRTRLKAWNNGTWSKDKGGKERGKDYNHSTYCDLVITGLIGLRPQEGDTLVINPLISCDYFCLDNVLYHGYNITILYDKTGKQYNKGKGFYIYIDGEEVAKSTSLKRLVINIKKSLASR